MIGTSERLEGAFFFEKRSQYTGGAWLSSARAVKQHFAAVQMVLCYLY